MIQTRRGFRLTGVGDPIRTAADEFDVYVFGMSHVGDHTYWHLSIVGRTREQTLSVKAATPIASLTPPAYLLAAVYAWLRTGLPPDDAVVHTASA